MSHFVIQKVVLNNCKQLKKDLNLYFDEENIVRWQGRLKNTPLNYSAKSPVLLTSGNYFTNFVIKFYHLVLHIGMVRRHCIKFVQSLGSQNQKIK